jgi:hypothetical protein
MTGRSETASVIGVLTASGGESGDTDLSRRLLAFY